jgi:hypothetical protein
MSLQFLEAEQTVEVSSMFYLLISSANCAAVPAGLPTGWGGAGHFVTNSSPY